ncbi:MAG TPA: hypothetical protein VI685_14295 [Candidatus Angelobacter sp.]
MAAVKFFSVLFVLLLLVALVLGPSAVAQGPITGTTATFQSLNSIQLCDQASGSDAGAKIAQCISNLPAQGGTADARGFGCTVQTISTSLNIGSSTKQVTLLIDPCTRFNVSVNTAGATPAIQIFNASAMDCGGIGSVLGGTSTAGGFYLTSAANISALIANGQQDATQEYMRLKGCYFQGNQSATVTHSLAYFKLLFVPSVVEDCVFSSVGSYTTVNIENVGVFAWINNWVNGAQGVPGLTLTPMIVNGATGDLTIVGGGIEHAGGGNPLLKIDATTGHNSGINTLRGIAIYGTEFEQQTGGGNGIEMINPTSVYINSALFDGNLNGTDAIKITETQAGAAQNVVLENIDNFAYPRTINDTAQGGRVVTDHTVAHYVHNATSYFSNLVSNTATFDAPTVNQDLVVYGSIYKGADYFRIDHPLDPANKYLFHSVVESPDMKNIYDGVVVLNETGEAEIELPNWFQALNKDFRYQLTCIGGSAPIYVAKEMQNNRFRIAGGRAGLKVSWQVTGIRQDAFATNHPMQVEQAKPERDRGHY